MPAPDVPPASPGVVLLGGGSAGPEVAVDVGVVGTSLGPSPVGDGCPVGCDDVEEPPPGGIARVPGFPGEAGAVEAEAEADTVPGTVADGDIPSLPLPCPLPG